jgi:hypothetical protein
MSTGPISRESDPLISFCRMVAERRENWPPREEVLAEEFVTFFGMGAFAHFGTLRDFCVQLGISVSVRPMPNELRGHNSSYSGSRTITIAEHQSFPGAQEHTLLHELRELLEHSFVRLGFAIAVSGEDLEERAEGFACLVRSNLSQRTLLFWLEQAEHVEKKWLRYCSYFLAILGGVIFVSGCLLLPVLEDAAIRAELQRKTARTVQRRALGQKL